MIWQRRFSIVLGLSLVGVVYATVSIPTDAKDQPAESKKTEPEAKQKKPAPKKLATKVFMRKKLSASQDIMEGLALEDFDLITNGARQLSAISAAAEFKASNDPLYAQQSADFRRAVTKLEQAAKKKNIDGATLAFMETTMKCVECHKFARTILIAQ